MQLPPNSRLRTFEACRIIYPGKNHDAWWDLKQFMENVEDAVNIFEHTHPNMVAIFIFDCSSSHEGLAENALNVNNMNVNSGGKQRHLCDTIIPTSNPPPRPGHPDTHGMPQSLVYPAMHPDAKLAGQPKGMRAVLEERVSVWDEYISHLNGSRPVGKCKSCQKSQLKKDTDRRVAAAEAMGQEDTLTEAEIDAAGNLADDVNVDTDPWCCIYKVISLQDDFANEKPLLQSYIEGRGHVCLFLPKFHCELNPIEMVWGYRKYRLSFSCIDFSFMLNVRSGFRNASNGKFTTAKTLVPQCLDLCDTTTIRRFFRKCWRYMDAYRYITAHAVKLKAD